MNVLDADQRVIAFHQRAYDYLLDRWGIYLGTYRTAIVVLGFADGIYYGAEKFVAGGPLIGSTLLIAIFGIVWMMFGREHMGVEWKLQNDGDFDEMNKAALNQQGYPGTVLRSCILLIQGSLLAVLLFFSPTIVELSVRLIATFFFVNWAYSLTVLVRDREPDRFLASAPSAP